MRDTTIIKTQKKDRVLNDPIVGNYINNKIS